MYEVSKCAPQLALVDLEKAFKNFFRGIPTMFAATGYELLAMLRHGDLGGEDWTALSVAFVASAITAFISVKWLLRYIESHRFTAFAVYRVVFGVALLLLVPAGQ